MPSVCPLLQVLGAGLAGETDRAAPASTQLRLQRVGRVFSWRTLLLEARLKLEKQRKNRENNHAEDDDKDRNYPDDFEYFFGFEHGEKIVRMVS